MIVQNPILPGFHPDPCAVRVGRDYYVATSTFEWFPGVEIHHSTDLAHWTPVARPLDTEDLLDMQGVPNSGGVWAPCLSYAQGVFYLVYSITRCVEETTQDTENYLTCATSITGPWSPRVRLHSGGFDASMFHDTDGTHWIVGMRWDSRVERDHFMGIYLQPFDVQTCRLAGEAKCIFRGSSLGLTEGPHLYRHKGAYLLMVAEGGTREDHAVLVCRSQTRDGLYLPDPQGPMLTARHRPDWPIQHAGHGSLVDDGADHWYLFHLGVRKGLFGGYSVLGRETFLQNVSFNAQGFPRLIGGDVLPCAQVGVPQPMMAARQPGASAMPHVQDCAAPPDASPAAALDAPGQNADAWALHCTFTGQTLPLRMAWLRTVGRHSLTERPGYLRLYGAESLLSQHRQCMVGTPLYAARLTAHTRLAFQPEHCQQAAGLVLFYHTANFYALLVTWDDALGRCLRLTRRDSKRTALLTPMVALPPTGEISLRATLAPEGIRFHYHAGEGWRDVGDPAQQPAHILSDEYANRCGEQGYTGAFAALCCQDQTGAAHPADFALFTLCPPDHPMLGREF